MAVDPETIQFGYANTYSEDYPKVGLICGDSQELNLNLVKTGNYDVENIRLNSAALNGPIVGGFRKSISSNYFGVDVASFSNPLTHNSETTKVSLTIPYNQASGTYTSTMFLYSDANNNGIFDSGEVTAEFNVSVCVNECKVIKVVDKVVNTGGWSRGTSTSDFTVNYFNAGNIAFTNAKIIGVGSLTSEVNINFSSPIDGLIGSIPVGEHKNAVFSAAIPVNATLGTYIATYTIFEDKNGNGIHDKPTEPFDTFQVRMTIGELDFSISTLPITTPTKITASPVETSYTAVTGVFPAGFNPLRITNNSSNGMPLTRIKMKADNFDGVDKNNNHYVMASSAVEIYPGSLKQPLESGETDVFDIEVYVAPGTRCATYTTLLHFYSDDNDNNNIDPGETNVNVILEVYVKPTEKVRVIDKPVAVTGMSSDVQDTFAECEFLCYNLGNVDLRHLRFEMQNLVQKDVPVPDTITADHATFSFVGDTPFVAPYNSEFSAKINIRIPHLPQRTKDGVYVTTAFCKIYNDNGGDPDNEVENLAYNNGECYDEFQVWLQIGEMKIVIINTHDVHGEPSERTNEGPFTVKNDGALTVTSVVATATDFIMGPNVIPATASVFLSSPKVGTLKPGFQRNVSWFVNIPDCMEAGDYIGKIIVWSDTDGNEEMGVAEASATAEVKITVDACPKLSIRNDSVSPTDIEELFTPFIMNNSTVKQCFRIYNTGNMPITEPIQIERNNLTFMTNAITTDDFSIDIDSVFPIQPGEFRLATVTVTLSDTHLVNGHYRGEQTFLVKSGETVLCSDKVTLDVEFGKKELILNPNPLIIDELNIGNPQTVIATRVPPAGLKKIYVYQKSFCTCGRPHCEDHATPSDPPDSPTRMIRMTTPLPVNIETSKDFNFIINLDEYPQTPPGEHIATWTFFDDSDGDGLYDEGEYFVDLEIRYNVPEKLQTTIEPPHYDEIDIAPGETKQITYYIKNTGNYVINCNFETDWGLPLMGTYIENMENPEFKYYLNSMPSSGFRVASYPVGSLGVNETTTCVIELVCPDDQELGIYSGVSPIEQSYLYSLHPTTINRISVVRRGPMVASDTVYQSVDSDTFKYCDVNNATESYFISAWICPGTPDTYNLSAANLSVIRCDKDGKPKAVLSVRLKNNDLRLENNYEMHPPEYRVYNDGIYKDLGPGDSSIDPATFSFCLKDGKPICGISGDPVTAIDETDPEENIAKKRRLTFYRVYFAFKTGERIDVDSGGLPIDPKEQDKIAIMLTQSASLSNTAITTVYFDGVKLEKSLWPDQDRPTTYHRDTTLVSPSSDLDVSGKHKHYEW